MGHTWKTSPGVMMPCALRACGQAKSPWTCQESLCSLVLPGIALITGAGKTDRNSCSSLTPSCTVPSNIPRTVQVWKLRHWEDL